MFEKAEYEEVPLFGDYTKNSEPLSLYSGNIRTFLQIRSKTATERKYKT